MTKKKLKCCRCSFSRRNKNEGGKVTIQYVVNFPPNCKFGITFHASNFPANCFAMEPGFISVEVNRRRQALG